MTSVAASRRRVGTAAVTVLGAAIVVYLPVLRDLVVIWATVPFYSHGFVVPLFSVYLARDALKDVARSRGGDDRAPYAEPAALAVTIGGLAVLVVGIATASLTLRALSIPVVLMGLAWALLGPASARRLAFPIAFLVFMAPLPDRVVAAISPPLQHLAAFAAEHALRALGITVSRQGLFVRIPSVTLHVTEDCTGLRFLLAMLVIGVACAAQTQRRPLRRATIVLAAVTLAVIANLARVTGTGVMAELWGARAAMGLPHLVWGKLVYGVMLMPFAGFVLLMRRRR